MTLFERLRQRKLVQWAAAYLAGAWLLLQVMDLVGDKFGWPDVIGRVVIVLVGVGFIIAVVLAWYHGEKGHQRVTTLELSMLVVLCIIAGTGVAFVGGGTQERDAAPKTGHATSSPSAPGAVEERSVAVLPFADMSPQKDQEYFSDGITEEILNALAQVPELRVSARTSSFSFKGKNVPVDSIGRTLKVAHVLEGSVRKAGDRIRITAQLIKADDGYHLWSQTYDGDLKDVFAIQDQVARSITQALQIRLVGSEQAVLVRQPTEDLEAYSLYLQGRHFWNRRGAENLQLAISYFERALARDPKFARAHAALAESYILLPRFVDDDPRAAQRAAREAANRALALDSTIAPAHAAFGELHSQLANWAQAEAAFRRALEHDPRDPTSRHWYCSLLRTVGRLEEALEQCHRAVTFDPTYLMANVHLGLTLLDLRRYAEAAKQLEHTVALDPTFALASARLAAAYALRGDSARALREAERFLALPAEKPAFDLGWVGWAFAVAGRPERAREILQDLQTRVARAGGATRPTHQALSQLYIGLGEHDRALDILAREIPKGGSGYESALFASPIFDPVRADPRFQAFLRQFDFPR